MCELAAVGLLQSFLDDEIQQLELASRGIALSGEVVESGDDGVVADVGASGGVCGDGGRFDEHMDSSKRDVWSVGSGDTLHGYFEE